jgi:hypothetical protein
MRPVQKEKKETRQTKRAALEKKKEKNSRFPYRDFSSKAPSLSLG